MFKIPLLACVGWAETFARALMVGLGELIFTVTLDKQVTKEVGAG